MDGQASQILENGAIDRGCSGAEAHYEAIYYYQEK